jgi:hypothetical protein
MRAGRLGLTGMLFVFASAGFVVGQTPRPNVPVPVDGLAGATEPKIRPLGGEPWMDQPIHCGYLLSKLLDQPAPERYEMLKNWSLPNEDRKSIRYYVGSTPRKQAPAPFVQRARIPLYEVVNTMTVLADAAKEAGKLLELMALADRLAGQKVENADLLQVLVYVSQDKGMQIEPILKAYCDVALQRLTKKKEPKGIVEVRPSEYLLAKYCLRDPALHWFTERLLGPMLAVARDSRNFEYMGRLHDLEDQLAAKRAGVPQAFADAAPLRWYNIMPQSHWLAQDGCVLNGHNNWNGFLLFDTPLAGTFEFSVDAYQGPADAGQIGYVGVVFEANHPGANSIAWGLGYRDRISRPLTPTRTDAFNRLTVQVSPKQVRCLANDKLYMEDTDPAPTSPWLMLVGPAGVRSVYRNAKLTGKPEPLKEVHLTSGDYFEGWILNFYERSNVPLRLLSREGRFRQGGFDWQMKDGELLGRKIEQAAGQTRPSALQYFRPMRPGELVRYEFFYEPGETHVYPCLDQVAFLIEPGGVRLHWIVDQMFGDWSGLALDNVVEHPQGQKLDKVPLNAGAWNAVTFETTAGALKLTVNGALVYEAEVPGDLGRRFGLFHYQDRTAARVRNAVLTGPWAKTIAPDDVGFATKAGDAAEARVRRSRIGELYYKGEGTNK